MLQMDASCCSQHGCWGDSTPCSTRDLLNILDAIGKAGAGFKSLKDTWADTITPHGRLMLTVLGGLAEFERELIHARTDDGRKRAKARGVKFGLVPDENPTGIRIVGEQPAIPVGT
jgi:DNA invertase Pin-like site-specific DNA recombinase